MEFQIVAKTFQGLEEVLAKEIIALGGNDVEIGRRMVSFTGDKEMLYKANFCLRTAVKVLKPIKTFTATDPDEVYEVVKKMDWSEYMDVDNTFLIDSVVFSDSFKHSKFVAYRVKDAIADYWRDKTGERPNVQITNPDLRINVHIADKTVTISLDSSGESLHLRGYKVKNTEAPINEVLAAGLVLLSGWDCECDLIDPFCGSGTILIEAALIAQNIYPGVFRKEYAFEKWKDFDEELFDRIYNDDSQERDFNHKIYGYDINRQAVQIALDNVQSAGVSKIVDVQQQDFYNFEQPVEKSFMITNPPYGERIGAGSSTTLDLYSAIGERLKHAFTGGDAWIISYHDECFARIGMRPSTRYALYNGQLECEFRHYQIFDGKLKERRSEGVDIKTAEERRHNATFKPHKKNEDGEWSRERKTEDEDHYFKSKPFDKPRKFRDNEDRPRRFKDGDSDRPRKFRDSEDRPRRFKGDDDKPRHSREDSFEERRSRFGGGEERPRFGDSNPERKRRPRTNETDFRQSKYQQRRSQFEAMDDEEAEIINRHLGKWDRKTRGPRPSRD